MREIIVLAIACLAVWKCLGIIEEHHTTIRVMRAELAISTSQLDKAYNVIDMLEAKFDECKLEQIEPRALIIK